MDGTSAQETGSLLKAIMTFVKETVYRKENQGASVDPAEMSDDFVMGNNKAEASHGLKARKPQRAP